jgi:arabinofuranosyltransferase
LTGWRFASDDGSHSCSTTITAIAYRGNTVAAVEPAPGAAAAKIGDGRPVLGRAQDRLAWWPLLVPLVVVLVGAWTYRWVDEDAFINFRVVHNLLAGHGPVFNVGERVEVSSDPLWLVTLTVIHWIVPSSLEWTAVVLGLVCTAGGFVAGGMAVARIGARHDEGTVLPLGLLMVSVVAGVWEFATSGLEMSMVFLWIGCSFLLLVRVEARRRGAVPAAIVGGLGTLIRPELALGALVFVLALLAVVASPTWNGGRGRLRRCLGVGAAAAAVPLAYELFRMAYYALLVPSTALAKAAASSWWSQGATYLWNFVAPYTLWLPLALATVVTVVRVGSWWQKGDRLGVLVLCTPLVVGITDLAYVVQVGGDYMHARLLLPAFFALCLPVFVGLRSLRGAMAVPAVGIVVWSVACLGWLRFVPPTVVGLTPSTVFISNERNSWITATRAPHPVTAGDYAQALSGKAGTLLARISGQVGPGHQRLLVITDPFAPIDPNTTRPATSTLPFTLAVNLPAIGVIGYLAGPDVYVFDSYSLANPVGSHTTVIHHARPGHEKLIGPSWMLARFGVLGMTTVPGGPSTAAVGAARAALHCDPLAAYLHAVTVPLTLSRALANIGDSVSFTTMQFSPDPTVAAVQLCGPQPARP